MKLEIDEKKKIGYLSFSWKEIWILIKKRKLSLAIGTIEHFTRDLLNLTFRLKELIKENKNQKK
tara:strand:- start:609 stop:800 length:192 start_codon:yes stop_codon:yes gene_type:complete